MLELDVPNSWGDEEDSFFGKLQAKVKIQIKDENRQKKKEAANPKSKKRIPKRKMQIEQEEVEGERPESKVDLEFKPKEASYSILEKDRGQKKKRGQKQIETNTENVDNRSRQQTPKVKPEEARVTNPPDHKLQSENDQKPKSPEPSKLRMISQPLTIAQKEAEEKLKASEFRWLNERLYTSTSKDAAKMFSDDPFLYESVCNKIPFCPPIDKIKNNNTFGG